MQYLRNESGAVTVDWVVLTAGLVGLGIATMGVVSTGVQDASDDINQQMTRSCTLVTFEQRQHAGLYCAMMERATFYDEDEAFADGQMQFEYMVNYFTNASEADLALWTAEGETIAQSYRDNIALYDSLIGRDLSEAEVMAELGIAETNPWTGQPNTLGGDPEAYLLNRRAHDMAIVEIQETRKIVAEDRGIDWQG